MARSAQASRGGWSAASRFDEGADRTSPRGTWPGRTGTGPRLMRIDLHLHSTASDGDISPTALVQAAGAAGLDVIALTDHDTAAGVLAAQDVAEDRPRLIPGIEVSCAGEGGELHFLGYYIDPLHPALVQYGGFARARREDRMREMIRRLGARGVSVAYEEVLELAGPESASLGRPHLARALVSRGVVRSFGEAFARFLADGGPAYVPVDLLAPPDAIELIHTAGGIAVWAHPPLEGVERETRRHAEAGLDGIECFRPRITPAGSQLLEGTAGSLGLLVTGGSDWHGPWHGPLGSFHLRREDVADFLAVGGL